MSVFKGGGYRSMLVLAVPLIVSNLSQSVKHLTDVLMLGWYGIDALAAVVLGATLWQVLFIIGTGFAMATITLAARSAGEGNRAGVRRYVRMGCWLAMAFACLVAPLMWTAGPIFRLLGQQADTSILAESYLRIALWGLCPALVAMTLKAFFLAIIRPQIILWSTLAGALFNVLLNYVLIFGHLGAPELGLAGAATASVVAHGLTLGIMVLTATRRPFRPYRLFHRIWRPDREAARQLFALGWPVSVTLIAETAFFGLSAIMAGWISTETLAAHGIVIEIAAFVFMVYLGLASAATTMSARAVGAGSRVDLILTYRAALHLTMLMVMATVVVFLTLPGPIIAGFLDPSAEGSERVRGIAVRLLMIAALFQLADAMQVVLLGLLRGLGDTRTPMIIAALSYLAVGIPCSYTLGFPLGYGIAGIWVGFIIGLGLAALLLAWRFRFKLAGWQAATG